MIFSRFFLINFFIYKWFRWKNLKYEYPCWKYQKVLNRFPSCRKLCREINGGYLEYNCSRGSLWSPHAVVNSSGQPPSYTSTVGREGKETFYHMKRTALKIWKRKNYKRELINNMIISVLNCWTLIA